MARSVYYHTDRTEIAFSHDNQEHVVSLLPYLQHPTDAVAVLYEIWNESTLEEEARWLVQTAGEKVDLVHQGIMHHADRLDGVDKEVTLLAEDDAIHVTIAAELLSPGTVVHASKINKSPTGGSEINTWVNRSVTLEGGDSTSDIEAVLLLTRQKDLGSGGYAFGLRGLGSTSTREWLHIYHSCNMFFPVAAPNGNYQIYVKGPTKGDFDFYTYVWELGYIKKEHGFHAILNWIDEDPSVSESWTTRAASSQVPSGADGMFAVQRDVTNSVYPDLFWHGLRSIGSSDIERIRPSSGPCGSADPVRLDSQKQYRFLQFYDPELYILAYTMLAEAAGAGTVKVLGIGVPIVLAPQASLTASPELVSLMTAVPSVESVMAAIPELADVMTGKPVLPEE